MDSEELNRSAVNQQRSSSLYGRRASLLSLGLTACMITLAELTKRCSRQWTEHHGASEDQIDILFVIDESTSMMPADEPRAELQHVL